MKRTLIVVDVQNDFVTGSLGTKEAQAIIPNIEKKISEYRDSGDKIIFTQDTHNKNYLNTHEGFYLPVKHCIDRTAGWCISHDIGYDCDLDVTFNKHSFGFVHWNTIDLSNNVEIIGLCTDICVISNALIIRSMYPNINITVDASCCAGTTPVGHEAALKIMKTCHINIIGEDK